MKKIYIAILLILSMGGMANAYDLVIDDIYYNYVSDDTVELARITSPGPSHMVVPSEIISNEKTYTVVAIAEYAFSKSAVEEVDIPPTITTIGMGAFWECFSLKKVNIPESVTYLGSMAFGDCQALEEIAIGAAIEDITDYMFAGCTSLKQAVFGSSVKTIGRWAFQMCSSLETLVLGESVASISGSAFASCTSLRSVTVLAMTPPEAGSNIFAQSAYSSAILKVPEDAMDAYRDTEPWSMFENVEIASDGGNGSENGDVSNIDTINGSNKLAVWVEGDSILIDGVLNGHVSVYDSLGRLRYAGYCKRIGNLSHGLYYVMADNLSVKVLVP